MSNRQQRENLARFMALVATQNARNVSDFVFSRLDKVPVPQYSTSIEELGEIVIHKIGTAFGCKLKSEVFQDLAMIAFTSTAFNLAEAGSSIEEIMGLIDFLDAFLTKNNIPVRASDVVNIHNIEKVVARSQSKHLHNLHLTQKVQERKVML